MSKEIYKKLREHLDKYPVGFPKTESGIELTILRKLFTQEEAKVALNLKLMPRPAKSIAKKLDKTEEETGKVLEEMAKKGLLFRFRHDKGAYYAGTMFAVGFYEYSLKRITKELARDYSKYFDEAFLDEFKKAKTPQLRVIPVEKSLTGSKKMEILTYDTARDIINRQEKIAVADCICRTEGKLLDHGCDKPMETCLLFSPVAEYYIENNMGREISKDEALQIIKTNDEAGLVISPVNARNTTAVCSCCGCCCNFLKAVKRQPKPSESVKSNFYAQMNSDDCTQCETCIDRCQMDAITMEEHAVIDLDKCIGCGLCVTTCTGEAITMKLKADTYEPPLNFRETYKKIAEESGKT